MSRRDQQRFVVASDDSYALIGFMNENRSPGMVAKTDERDDYRREALLLRIPDAAALLGVGRTTLYKLINQRELAPVHIGRAARIPIAEVHAFVARHRRTDVVR